MSDFNRFQGRTYPALGCATIAVALFFLILVPLVLVDAMTSALQKLHLSAGVAMLAVLGIFLGSLINVPIHRVQRQQEQPVETLAIFGFWGEIARFHQVRQDTIVAVNIGGCVIPTLLALWQVGHLVWAGGWPLVALLLVTTANIAVCYRFARPVQGVGIIMPGFLSPLTAICLCWLLLGSADYDLVRAPVAFTAGVCGPLIGADLFHLNDLTKVSLGMLSIGGAGTFDGIVLSGVLAALLT